MPACRLGNLIVDADTEKLHFRVTIHPKEYWIQILASRLPRFAALATVASDTLLDTRLTSFPVTATFDRDGALPSRTDRVRAFHLLEFFKQSCPLS